MLATGIVLLGVITTYVIHVVTGLPMTTMVGILSGAVTNTPGLGAAQQAYSDMTGVNDPTIALGYAVAYPLGVIGIIGSILLMRVIFRVKFEKENEDLERQDEDRANGATVFCACNESGFVRQGFDGNYPFDKPEVRVFSGLSRG